MAFTLLPLFRHVLLLLWLLLSVGAHNFILISHMDKCDLDRKESTCNARDPGSAPGLGRSPGEGNSYLFHCSCHENSMDRGSWQATITSDPSPWGCKELDMTEKLTLSHVSLQFSSVQLIRSVVSDSLRPYGPQLARPPCPSPTPRVYPKSCPLSW